MLNVNNDEYCSPLGWFNKCFTPEGPRGYKGSAGKPGRPGFIGPPGPTVSPPDDFFSTPPNIFLPASNYVYIFLQGHVGVLGKPGPKVIQPPSRINYKSIFKFEVTTNALGSQKSDILHVNVSYRDTWENICARADVKPRRRESTSFTIDTEWSQRVGFSRVR